MLLGAKNNLLYAPKGTYLKRYKIRACMQFLFANKKSLTKSQKKSKKKVQKRAKTYKNV